MTLTTDNLIFSGTPEEIEEIVRRLRLKWMPFGDGPYHAEPNDGGDPLGVKFPRAGDPDGWLSQTPSGIDAVPCRTARVTISAAGDA